MDIGICGAGVEGSTDGCVSRVDWLGVWPVSVRSLVERSATGRGQSGEAAGGLREPVGEFSGRGPGSHRADPGGPEPEGTEG